MVTIHNKIGNMTFGSVQQTRSLRELMIDCLDFISPAKGVNNAEQRKRNRVASKLESYKNEDTLIELEDEDFNTLFACNKEMIWAVRSQLITDLEDELERVKKEMETKKE